MLDTGQLFRMQFTRARGPTSCAGRMALLAHELLVRRRGKPKNARLIATCAGYWKKSMPKKKITAKQLAQWREDNDEFSNEPDYYGNDPY